MLRAFIVPFSLLFIVLISCIQTTSAQKTLIYSDVERDYKTGLELFNHEKYGAAQKLFEQIGTKDCALGIGTSQDEIKTNSEYYTALCALELFNTNAESLLKLFIDRHPESPKLKYAIFQLGKFYYRNKSYKQAVEWLEQVEIYDLSNNELAEYYFKIGYAYFILSEKTETSVGKDLQSLPKPQTQYLEKASKNFFQIKDANTQYSAPATYYYAHIAYLKNNYETALVGFQKLGNDKNFGPVVPYYIAQIYYLQGKYEQVITYAPPFLQSPDTKRATEIHRLVGESYYRTSRYKEAIAFLEYYANNAGQLNRDDNYELAYAYYKSGLYDKAIKRFENAATLQDSITQNIQYHIADCFLHINNKLFARNSFRSAAKMDFDKQIKEDALFNYAKLSYELDINPYNEAIISLEEYIKSYPNTERAQESFEYLVNVFLTTKNYKDALVSMEKIKDMNEKMKASYQKIAYFRGVDLFNDQNYGLAIVHFDKSLQHPIDKTIEANAIYWKAECYYNLKKWDAAIEQYKNFQFAPGSAPLSTFNIANYNIGYVYFKRQDYANANTWFRKFVSDSAEMDMKKLFDAYLRIGDNYYMIRNYESAIEYYEKVIVAGVGKDLKSLPDADYATYQVAVTYGLMGKGDKKVQHLENLIKTYPQSNYAAAAKYELGVSYLNSEKKDDAMTYFKKVVVDHPNSSLVKKSLLNIALIYYNDNSDDPALAGFKKIVEDYPGSEEAREALQKIKQIYINHSQVNLFEEYIKGKSFTDVSQGSLDTANYESAEKRYQSGEFAAAARDFLAYLNRYPNGYFMLNATFYMGECDYSLGNYENALKSYNSVIGRPKNLFTEKALLRAGDIYFNKLKNYNDALLRYTMLEEVSESPAYLMDARIGLMRCNVLLIKYDGAIEYAKKLLTMEKIAPEITNEAHLTIARSALAMKNLPLALEEFDTTARITTGATAAEAKFNVAFVQYMMEKYQESQKTIFELVNQSPSADYWLAKAFLLLSDCYVKQNDLFQAKLTLQNLIDNYSGEEIGNIARDKLKTIKATEEAMKPKTNVEDVKVQFETNDSTSNPLFEEKGNKENKEIKEEKKDEKPKE